MNELLTQAAAYWQAYGQFVLYALMVGATSMGVIKYFKNVIRRAQFWILVAILFAVL